MKSINDDKTAADLGRTIIGMVAGVQVQHDPSGVGHAWRNIDAGDIPANIILEIEGEIIDGGAEECADFIGSNGLHYRWTVA